MTSIIVYNLTEKQMNEKKNHKSTKFLPMINIKSINLMWVYTYLKIYVC